MNGALLPTAIASHLDAQDPPADDATKHGAWDLYSRSRDEGAGMQLRLTVDACTAEVCPGVQAVAMAGTLEGMALLSEDTVEGTDRVWSWLVVGDPPQSSVADVTFQASYSVPSEVRAQIESQAEAPEPVD